MTRKVMISSVRRGGLGPVRDAVAPVLKTWGYEPLRFEDIESRPIPSRAVCLDLVEQADIYLLLLGGEYGDQMPETGLAPTHEEWSTARRKGMPIVVFRQSGITPEPQQEAFMAEVEAYGTGVFRGSFAGVAIVLQGIAKAAGRTLTPAEMRALLADVNFNTTFDDPAVDRIGVMPSLA